MKSTLKKKYSKIVISPGPGNPNQAGNCLKIVRDLHKKDDSLEQQSYSERQIYLTALNRLSNEYAAVQNLEKKLAKVKLEELLNQ